MNNLKKTYKKALMKKILLSLSLLTTFMACCVTAKADPCVNEGVLELGAGQSITNCQVYTNNGLLIINDGIVSITGSIKGQKNQFINKGTVLIKERGQLQLGLDQYPSLENDKTIYVQGVFYAGTATSFTNNGSIFIANTGTFMLRFNPAGATNASALLNNNGLIVNDGAMTAPIISNSQSGIFNLNSSGRIQSGGLPSDLMSSFAIENDGQFNICQNGTIPDGASLSGKPINFLQHTC